MSASGEGPIIAASGKVPVSVGYADWLASEQPALLVRAANAWAIYEDPGPGWHDLALTHTASSGSFVLYVDGERRCPINNAPEAAGDCELKQVLPGPVACAKAAPWQSSDASSRARQRGDATSGMAGLQNQG